jgi:hypothetical protein
MLKLVTRLIPAKPLSKRRENDYRAVTSCSFPVRARSLSNL